MSSIKSYYAVHETDPEESWGDAPVTLRVRHRPEPGQRDVVLDLLGDLGPVYAGLFREAGAGTREVREDGGFIFEVIRFPTATSYHAFDSGLATSRPAAALWSLLDDHTSPSQGEFHVTRGKNFFASGLHWEAGAPTMTTKEDHEAAT